MVMEANQKVQEINITLNEYMPEFKSESKSKYKSWSSSEIISGDVNNHTSEHRRQTNHNIVWDSQGTLSEAGLPT